jgi:hypothetical protein
VMERSTVKRIAFSIARFNSAHFVSPSADHPKVSMHNLKRRPLYHFRTPNYYERSLLERQRGKNIPIYSSICNIRSSRISFCNCNNCSTYICNPPCTLPLTHMHLLYTCSHFLKSTIFRLYLNPVLDMIWIVEIRVSRLVDKGDLHAMC